MKNIFFVIAFLGILLISTGLMGQVDNFSIGPRIGLNLAKVSNVDESSAIVGLALGVTSTYSISQNSGVTLDILYSQEGYEDENSDQEIHFDYLQVPMYFDVFFGELGEAFRPKIYAGVSLGFLLSAKAGQMDIKEDVSSTAFSLTGGLGFNYRLSNRVWLNTDLRSFWGLSDIPEDASPDVDTVAARNLQFSVGIAFGLSKLN